MLKYSKLTLDCNACQMNGRCHFQQLQYDWEKIPNCPMLRADWLNPRDIIIAAKPVTTSLLSAWLVEQKQ